MTHEQARSLILADHVEPLEHEAGERLRQHLASCPPCGEYAEQVERGLAAFRSHAVVADGELIRRTRARLRERIPSRAPSAAALWVPVAASLVACLSTASSFGLSRQLAATCHDTLGVPASAAVGCVAAGWLLFWALGALATVTMCDRPRGDGRRGRSQRLLPGTSGRM